MFKVYLMFGILVAGASAIGIVKIANLEKDMHLVGKIKRGALQIYLSLQQSDLHIQAFPSTDFSLQILD